jgi:hypothetical protein
VGSFWLHDPGQLCYQGYHRAWAFGLGLPLLVVVCGLLPATLLWVLLRHRQQLQLPTQDSNRMSGHSFLVFVYRPVYCWWELVVLFENAVLTAVAVFGFRLGPLHQIIAFSCVLALCGLLQIAAAPFVLPAANTVMLQSICCLFFSNMANVLFLTHGGFPGSAVVLTAVASVVLCVNVVFVGSVMWRIVKLLRRQTASVQLDKSVAV